MPGQQLTAAFQLPFERDDVTIRLELREREVQQVVRHVGGIPLHEVRGHVVRRPERRAQRVRSAGSQRRHLVEGHERAPAHDRVPDVVDPPPPCAPGELGVFAGREELVLLTRELRQLLDHDRPGGHVDPERERLRREHHLHEAGTERLLDRFLHRRDHPGVMRGEAGLEAGDPLAVPQDLEVLVRQGVGVLLGDATDLGPFVRARQPEPAGHALLNRLIAPGSAEDERDRRQHAPLREDLDDLDASRGPEPAARAPAPTRGPPTARVEARRFGVGSSFPVALDERREQVNLIAAPLPHHVEMLEADRSPLLDDRRRLSPHRLDPRCELLGIRDRRRQAHHANVGREVNDDLFPHRAAVRVLEVVHLVEDHESQTVEGRRPRVDHVAQHLGRHDHDGRVAVDRVVSREEPDAPGAVLAAQVPELLVGQRLERRRVEGLAAVLQGVGDRVLGHDRLAGPRRRGDEHRLAAVDRVERAALEGVEGERPARLERLAPACVVVRDPGFGHDLTACSQTAPAVSSRRGASPGAPTGAC